MNMSIKFNKFCQTFIKKKKKSSVNLWLLEEGEWGIDREFGTDMYTLLYLK